MTCRVIGELLESRLPRCTLTPPPFESISMGVEDEREWQTRKKRIDGRLAALGWRLAPFRAGQPAGSGACAVCEYETASGPADYALCVDGRVLAIVEAKKVTLGPQNALVQAERYGERSGRWGVRLPRAACSVSVLDQWRSPLVP